MSAKETNPDPPTLAGELKENFPANFFTNRLVAEFTSTRLGGPTEYMVIAETVEDLMTAANLATKYRLPFVVVGGGTGLLASDVGYPGLVIINRSDRIMTDVATSQVVVDAGVMTDRLLNACAAKGLGGLEFLAGIPGTVGGAVATNATYLGKETASVVKEIILFVPGVEAGQVVSVTSDEITLEAYQRLFPESVISPTTRGENSNKIYIQSPVILSVRLQFSQTDQIEIIRRLLAIRRERQKLLNSSRLGQVFVQSLKSVELDRVTLNRFRKLGVLVDVNSETILPLNGRTNAQALRQTIAAIKTLAESAGIQLDERLHFLGYWPDGRSAEQSASTDAADAESF